MVIRDFIFGKIMDLYSISMAKKINVNLVLNNWFLND